MRPILFIDDDVLSLELMSKATMLLGHQAILSTSAQKALTLAKREKPSLILVDMQMDDMSGTDFVRQVRCSPDIAHLPVFIYSAGTGYGDEERARQAGANGFIQKPLELRKLSQMIQSYMV